MLSGVNKLRGRSSKDKDKEAEDSPPSSESEEEVGEPDVEENPIQEDPNDPSIKRSVSLPLPSATSTGTPPQTPRRNSDPLPPLESILIVGEKWLSSPFLSTPPDPPFLLSRVA